jgi:hypothetical protein
VTDLPGQAPHPLSLIASHIPIENGFILSFGGKKHHKTPVSHQQEARRRKAAVFISFIVDSSLD